MNQTDSFIADRMTDTSKESDADEDDKNDYKEFELKDSGFVPTMSFSSLRDMGIKTDRDDLQYMAWMVFTVVTIKKYIGED